MKIEVFRSLNVKKNIETIINTSEKVKRAKRDNQKRLSRKERKELSEEEKRYKSMRKKYRKNL